MAMAKWVILFTFLLSYSLWIIMGLDTTFTSILSCFGDTNNPIGGGAMMDPNTPALANASCNLGGINLFTDLKSIMLGLAGLGLLGVTAGVALGSITAGTIKFPDPYTLFGVASVFLFFFFTFPIGTITASFIPTEFKILFGGYYSIAYILTFFEFASKGVM